MERQLSGNQSGKKTRPRRFLTRKMQLRTRSPAGFRSKYQMKLLHAFEEQEKGFAWQTRRPRALLSGNLFGADCEAEKLA